MNDAESALIDPRLFAPGTLPLDGASATLAGSRCTSCGRHEFPVRATCPVCSSSAEVVPLSAAGVITGYSAVLHQPPGALVEAPYPVAAVALPEGITVLGIVDGPWEVIHLGAPVVTVMRLIGDRLGFAFRLT